MMGFVELKNDKPLKLREFFQISSLSRSRAAETQGDGRVDAVSRRAPTTD